MDKHSYPKYRGTVQDDCLRFEGRIFAVFSFIVVGVALLFSVGSAMDKSIDNQNRMLCSSAQVSGNTDWLSKCDRFYATGDVEYLR
jgi:hypothetical protein